MKMHPHPFLEIHPRDAGKLGIQEGQMVELRSRRGRACFPALITQAITPGCVFVPMHWGALWENNAEANSLTHAESCPISLQPELKACAVEFKHIGSQRQEVEAKSLTGAKNAPK
jgi:ferredoxin-nitrate reductase